MATDQSEWQKFERGPPLSAAIPFPTERDGPVRRMMTMIIAIHPYNPRIAEVRHLG
jgi:hypothetical protein